MKAIKEANFRIKIEDQNLAIAVAQDFKTNEVLMVAFMNKEALEKTLLTGKMHYYSISRKKLWLKGEKSSHFQVVKEAYVDCDGDSFVFKVEQVKGACHKGYRSCFFRKINEKVKIVKRKIFNPESVYLKGAVG